MKYYSLEDIEAMKRNECQKTIIDSACVIQRKADKLITTVRSAFSGVKLEDGIGLFEAQGIDDYETKEDCLKLRENDEKENWQKIAIPSLNHCYSSLSFFDPKGMRFHLPAFIIADIKDQYMQNFGLQFSLITDYNLEQYSALDLKQRIAVRQFIEYMIANEDYSYEKEHLKHAIEVYWSKD